MNRKRKASNQPPNVSYPPAQQGTTPKASATDPTSSSSLSSSPPPVAVASNNSTTTVASSNQQQQQQDTMIKIEPQRNDVLCGRGGAINQHGGNQLFRRVVAANKALYQECERHIKPLVAKSIVAALAARGGRFLKERKQSGEVIWIDIGTEASIAKTSQALREDSRGTRESLKVEQGRLDTLAIAAYGKSQSTTTTGKATIVNGLSTATAATAISSPANKKQELTGFVSRVLATSPTSTNDTTAAAAAINSNANNDDRDSSPLSLPFPQVSPRKRKAMADSLFSSIESTFLFRPSKSGW